MRAEIITIGTELLTGSTLNTHSKTISVSLAKHGVDVFRHTSIGDNPSRILSALKSALKHNDLVITCGGLGPTEDDATLKAVSKCLSRPLYLDASLESYVRKQYYKKNLSPSNSVYRQCWVPKKSTLCMNPAGTAPGLVHFLGTFKRPKVILNLPGPPSELNALLSPTLKIAFKQLNYKPDTFLIKRVKLTGLLETDVADKIEDLLQSKPPLTVGIYAKPRSVELQIMCKHQSRSVASGMIRKVLATIQKRLSDYIYAYDDESFLHMIEKRLLHMRQTLAVAESCTAGLLASQIGARSGCSRYFKGGIVAYSNELKTRILKVPKQVLATSGAVSARCAESMALGVLKNLRVHTSIAITGIAGPSGGSAHKKVGLVYIAVGYMGRVVSKKFNFTGDRQRIRERACIEALAFLSDELKRNR